MFCCFTSRPKTISPSSSTENLNDLESYNIAQAQAHAQAPMTERRKYNYDGDPFLAHDRGNTLSPIIPLEFSSAKFSSTAKLLLRHCLAPLEEKGIPKKSRLFETMSSE
ncbi:hypothetical protein DFQ27_007994 [Actinomortierella ambigua]|uniref:Uncharacterized protein n=1 Tax=Actinomortierella ambigua TaxID=1343610 RepID=A0A9P6PTC4_9FUNG|nr:hypothetical protein DFQ27_007994 [Actinomortierella ambigua]